MLSLRADARTARGEDAMPPTRVYWAGGAGFVRVDGRQVRLQAPPHLQGLRVLALDWVPQQCAMVLPVNAGWRELEGHEIDQVRAIAAARLQEGTP